MNIKEQEEVISRDIVNCCVKIHRSLGPGLLERVYEVCLAHELTKLGFQIKRQVNIPIAYDGIIFNEGLRLDLLVENLIIIELKAVEQVNPVWQAQVISHLKLLDKRLGFLVNFNVPLMKYGIKRFIN
ncbi:MAG: GxxExxY protein [Bacteroidota bacterium]